MKKKDLEVQALTQVDVNKAALIHNHKDNQKQVKKTINKDIND